MSHSISELPEDKDEVKNPNADDKNATDPPEEMEGPISSLMHSIQDKMEESDKEEPPSEKKGK